MRTLLETIYQSLHGHFGHRNWWPGDTPFEIAVGAILTQNTSWANVTKAIDNLKGAGVLTQSAMARLPQNELEELIRPSGFFRVKGRRLKCFLDYLAREWEGDMSLALAGDLTAARERLLGVSGIGPETADSILLYAGGRPVFVVDAYTKRVLVRHDLVDETASYHDIQALFMDHLPHDAELFNDFHAQFVAVGKEYCRPKHPRCSECPLEGILPEKEPIRS
ncbi:MAG: endonuclease III domain-containing protein [Deltaproteobacteria bacterium]|nr:endonuclease III domain-containing protein [Candidatus Zymogenaceae bacterium]